MKSLIILWLLVLGVLIGLVLWGDVLIAGLNRTHLRVGYESEPSITAVNSKDMQPFGVGAEDDDTAQLHVLPTHNPQVTAHSVFVYSTHNPQGSR